MMISMVLAKYCPGESPLSKPFAWIVAMIDRLHAVGQVASVPGVGYVKISDSVEGLQELASEDFWSRE